MIQRIQTVYLAIAAVLMALPVLIPGGLELASADATGTVFSLFAEKVVERGDVVNTLEVPYGLIASLMVGLVLTVYAIMKFKNRKLQMKIIQASMLVQLVFGAFVFFYAGKLANLAVGGELTYSPSLAIVLVNLILLFLAFRGVKKDDALVRSADRLR